MNTSTGICTSLYTCPDDHNPQVSGSLEGTRNWMCDKLKHDVNDPLDPCSECRQFGGANHECTLEPSLSYNEVVYNLMKNRIEEGYTLLPPKDRTEGTEEENAGPMTQVKEGWKGETQEELLAKPDFLPEGVRDCPRAYVTDPGKSERTAKSLQYCLDHPEESVQQLGVASRPHPRRSLSSNQSTPAPSKEQTLLPALWIFFPMKKITVTQAIAWICTDHLDHPPALEGFLLSSIYHCRPTSAVPFLDHYRVKSATPAQIAVESRPQFPSHLAVE
ncbi:unnamed protein product [Aureobasidium uvarum]|uniref:Uncharacterized protein n=1 Tax=Aureobasidium uvarum TaxID=2773716 RepID=A0A9N8KNE6_9PEZI|nr:unnamed protein product [Aureobasidium uvarum]